MSNEHAGSVPPEHYLGGIAPDLVSRYVLNLCSPDEEQEIHRWLAASPAHMEELGRWRRIWTAQRPAVRQATRAFDPNVGTAATLNRIGHLAPSALAAPTNPTVHPPVSAPKAGQLFFRRLKKPAAGRPHIWSRWVGKGGASWRVAAIAAVAVVGVGIAVLWRGSPTSNPRFLTPAAREYTTTAGQRLSATLVDGTQLMLAPASRLSVPFDYGRGDRAVRLDGEAFFTVVHDPAHPFVVRAGNAVATDVGTRFDVRSYVADSAVRVAIADGRVSLHASTRLPPSEGDHPSVLAHGDVAIVASTRITVAHGVDVTALTAWTAGRLVFRDTPLRDAVVAMSRWYGVSVVLGDSRLAERRVSVTTDEPSVRVLLDALAPAVGARYDVRDGGAYTLFLLP